jgi:hypothetical protein
LDATPNICRVSGGIFLLRGDDELVEMGESPYEAEDVLQALIAKFPSLLAGDQYSGAGPRRWLLVGREAALPDDQDAVGRWSVDHLFLDQDAVPTLVEVKRSSDTRIRREVVGQMLDYVANGVVYWPLEQLRELFARQCERDGEDPDALVADVAGADTDVDEFWQRAGENLRAGKVRLVFLSDEIPGELRRVVEFLNGQMSPAEVIAIEVKQYVGADGTKTLVPRVIGQTAEVEARKGARASGSRRQWDERSLFAELLEKRGQEETRVARELYDWIGARGWRSTFGTGKQDGSWIPVVSRNGQGHYPIALYTYGRIEVQFQHLKARPPFDDEQTRLELLRLINEIPGVSFDPRCHHAAAFHPTRAARPGARCTRPVEASRRMGRSPDGSSWIKLGTRITVRLAQGLRGELLPSCNILTEGAGARPNGYFAATGIARQDAPPPRRTDASFVAKAIATRGTHEERKRSRESVASGLSTVAGFVPKAAVRAMPARLLLLCLLFRSS